MVSHIIKLLVDIEQIGHCRLFVPIYTVEFAKCLCEVLKAYLDMAHDIPQVLLDACPNLSTRDDFSGK